MSNGKPIKLEELLELRDIVMSLHGKAARLVEFEDKHLVALKMKASLDKCIKEIEEVAHILHYDIYQMKKDVIKNETGPNNQDM